MAKGKAQNQDFHFRVCFQNRSVDEGTLRVKCSRRIVELDKAWGERDMLKLVFSEHRTEPKTDTFEIIPVRVQLFYLQRQRVVERCERVCDTVALRGVRGTLDDKEGVDAELEVSSTLCTHRTEFSRQGCVLQTKQKRERNIDNSFIVRILRSEHGDRCVFKTSVNRRAVILARQK